LVTTGFIPKPVDGAEPWFAFSATGSLTNQRVEERKWCSTWKGMHGIEQFGKH